MSEIHCKKCNRKYATEKYKDKHENKCQKKSPNFIKEEIYKELRGINFEKLQTTEKEELRENITKNIYDLYNADIKDTNEFTIETFHKKIDKFVSLFEHYDIGEIYKMDHDSGSEIITPQLEKKLREKIEYNSAKYKAILYFYIMNKLGHKSHIIIE